MKTVRENFMKFLKYMGKGGIYGMYVEANGGGECLDPKILEMLAQT